MSQYYFYAIKIKYIDSDDYSEHTECLIVYAENLLHAMQQIIDSYDENDIISTEFVILDEFMPISEDIFNYLKGDGIMGLTHFGE